MGYESYLKECMGSIQNSLREYLFVCVRDNCREPTLDKKINEIMIPKILYWHEDEKKYYYSSHDISFEKSNGEPILIIDGSAICNAKALDECENLQSAICLEKVQTKKSFNEVVDYLNDMIDYMAHCEDYGRLNMNPALICLIHRYMNRRKGVSNLDGRNDPSEDLVAISFFAREYGRYKVHKGVRQFAEVFMKNYDIGDFHDTASSEAGSLGSISLPPETLQAACYFLTMNTSFTFAYNTATGKILARNSDGDMVKVLDIRLNVTLDRYYCDKKMDVEEVDIYAEFEDSFLIEHFRPCEIETSAFKDFGDVFFKENYPLEMECIGSPYEKREKAYISEMKPQQIEFEEFKKKFFKDYPNCPENPDRHPEFFVEYVKKETEYLKELSQEKNHESQL